MSLYSWYIKDSLPSSHQDSQEAINPVRNDHMWPVAKVGENLNKASENRPVKPSHALADLNKLSLSNKGI